MIKANKKIIGRLENINIPTLGLSNITAKIDTGAYTGSIHASNIEEVEKDGDKVLNFTLLDPRHDEYDGKIYEIKEYETWNFRSTQGDLQERFVIPIVLEIAGEVIDAKLSLSDRRDLRYPILIGRKPLKKRFLVNVARKYIHG